MQVWLQNPRTLWRFTDFYGNKYRWLKRINHRYTNWHTKSPAGLSRAFSSTTRFIPTKLELPTSSPCLHCLPDSNLMTMDGWLSHPAALLPKLLMPGTFSLWKLSWAAFHRKGNGPTSSYCPEFGYHILLGLRNLAKSLQWYLFCGCYLNSRGAELLEQTKGQMTI